MSRTFVASSNMLTNASNTPYQKCKSVTFTGCAVGDLLVVIGANDAFYNGGEGDVMSTTVGTTSGWNTAGNPLPVNDAPSYMGGWATATSTGTITVAVGMYQWDTTIGMQVVGWRIPAGEWDSGTTPAWSSTYADTDANMTITIGQANSSLLMVGYSNNNNHSTSTLDPAGGTKHQASDAEPFALAWDLLPSGSDTFGFSGITGDLAYILAIQYEGVVQVPDPSPVFYTCNVLIG